MRMHRYIGPVVIVLLTATHVNAQSRDATGTLAGCVTDGYPISGLTIDLSAKGVHRTTVSNAAGCYEFTGLSRGSYVVFARLQGFGSVTRDQIAITPGRSERRDFQMYVRPIWEFGTPTISSVWYDADAVVRIRITGHQPGPKNPDRGNGLPSIKHTATVLGVMKPHPMARSSTTLTFLQGQMGEELGPFAVGQEFVIFLRWASTQGVFVTLPANEDGRTAAFAIENGRIQSAPFKGYFGLSAGELLAQLRAFFPTAPQRR
jgi:hypothetical protein